MGLVIENVYLQDISDGNASRNATVPAKAGCGNHFSCILFLTVIYLFGIIGNLMALMHLCRRKSFKNTIHPLMLKCLISNNLVGLIGMILQMYLLHYLPTELKEDQIIMRWTCVGRVLCRVFGLNSGCVALVMALERFLALTKPFTYQQCVTKRLIGNTIICMWIFVLCWTCLPFTGFGLYFDDVKPQCVRYREATDFYDIVYAYAMFTLGMLLCAGIVACNLSVTKVLCKAHYSRRGSTSSLYYQQVNLKCMTRTLFHTSSRPSFNNSVPTSDEIRFAKLMLILSISFVLCWCPQMITILLFQLLPPGTRFSLIFAKVADILLLLHFVSDPYIYVLLRNRRKKRNNFNNLMKKIFTNKPDSRQSSVEEECNRINLGNNSNNNSIHHSANNHNNNSSNNSTNNSRRTSGVSFSPAGQISGTGGSWTGNRFE